jgi:hypothetical protein
MPIKKTKTKNLKKTIHDTHKFTYSTANKEIQLAVRIDRLLACEFKMK